MWHRGGLTAPLAAIEALLVDLDGVLYVDDEPVTGAREAVVRLRAAGLALRFVTNTTSHSRAQTLAKLHRLGFDVSPGELVTPATLAVRECLARGHRRALLVVNEEVKEDFAELIEDDGARAEAVIVGDIGAAFGYDVLNRVFRAVMDGADLVALQKNRYWLRADGLSLDVGPFVAALEYATRREAVVVGKPARSFFAVVLGELGVEPGGAAMVGDDVESDVGGALAAGLAGVLVRTGKYRDDAPQRLRDPAHGDAGLDRRSAGPPGSALVGPDEVGPRSVCALGARSMLRPSRTRSAGSATITERQGGRLRQAAG